MLKPSTEKNPIDYSSKFFVRLVFVLSVIFLFLPLFAIVVFSFNNSSRITIWEGFTWANYGKVFADAPLIDAFTNSLTVGFLASLISLLLAVMAACALRLYNFKFRNFYNGLLSVPIVIPEICMGISLLIFYNKVFGSLNVGLPWPLNLVLVVCAHITFCFPFATMVIEARLRNLNPDFLEAAADLGANNWQILKDIIVPYLRPALLSAFLLSLTLSLDDFVITFFTTGPDTVTFPVKIYSMLRFSVTPEVNAASSVLIAITLLLTLVSSFLQKNSAMKIQETTL